MTRARDYQPTLDRAAGAAERAARKISRLQEKADDHHREMLRAQAAARIAGEEADALRDRITGLEQSVRDLKRENAKQRASLETRGRIVHEMSMELDEARHPFRTAWRRLREAMRIGAEA